MVGGEKSSCNYSPHGHGIAVGKVRAKKKAAFIVLVRMMMSAGLATEEMESAMWKTMERDQ